MIVWQLIVLANFFSVIFYTYFFLQGVPQEPFVVAIIFMELTLLFYFTESNRYELQEKTSP